jgi:hypothetical protein
MTMVTKTINRGGIAIFKACDQRSIFLPVTVVLISFWINRVNRNMTPIRPSVPAREIFVRVVTVDVVTVEIIPVSHEVLDIYFIISFFLILYLTYLLIRFMHYTPFLMP